MVYEYLIMVLILNIFDYQYKSIPFIIPLDTILVFNNIITYLILKLLFPINSKQINLILIFILIHFIYLLLTFLNESISTFHFLFVSKFINYEVLQFYLLQEHLLIQAIIQEQAIHLPPIINMIFIYKPQELNWLSQWLLHL